VLDDPPTVIVLGIWWYWIGIGVAIAGLIVRRRDTVTATGTTFCAA
jgi:hypothetical protein